MLVYVVDSSDRGRLPLAKMELHRLLRVQPQLPVVVLGNKQVRIKSSRKVENKVARMWGGVIVPAFVSPTRINLTR